MPRSEAHAGFRRDELSDADGVEAIAETMQALSAPSRVRLLYALRGGELSVGQLAEAAGLAPAAASQQLRILRHLRFVAARRDAQSIRYRLHDDHVGALLDEVRNHVEHAARGWEGPPPEPRRASGGAGSPPRRPARRA